MTTTDTRHPATTTTLTTTLTFTLPLLTAREYLDDTEPHVVGLMLNSEAALRADTLKATKVAGALGLGGADGRFPRAVWSVVYPA